MPQSAFRVLCSVHLVLDPSCCHGAERVLWRDVRTGWGCGSSRVAKDTEEDKMAGVASMATPRGKAGGSVGLMILGVWFSSLGI